MEELLLPMRFLRQSIFLTISSEKCRRSSCWHFAAPSSTSAWLVKETLAMELQQ